MWKLGLDLGTNSIGWTVFTSEKTKPSWDDWRLEDAGVRIIPDGREPATKGRVGDSRAVNRRLARGTRRNRDHGLNRIRHMAGTLVGLGLLPEDHTERQLRAVGCPYALRAKAVDGTTKLTFFELGRVLLHLGKRRGFLSNRKTDADDKELTVFKQKIGALEQALEGRTLGQFLYEKLRDGRAVRFRGEGGDHYPNRAMYADEFDRIRAQQAPFHTLTDADWDNLRDNGVLFQHPLRPAKRGACTLYPERERTYRDTPIAQRFRIFKEVANLRWIDGQLNESKLTAEQFRAIADKLLSQKTASFSSLRKLKDAGKQPLFPKDGRFNLEGAARKALNGDGVGRRIRDDQRLSGLWRSRCRSWWDDVFDLLHTPVEQAEAGAAPRPLSDDELIAKLIADFGLTSEQAEALAFFPLSSITVNYSRRAMEDLLPFIEDQGLDEYHATVELLGEEKAKKYFKGLRESEEIFDKLPYYGAILTGSLLGADLKKPADKDPEGHYGKIGNPTVHIALNQVRKLVNELIARFGSIPDAIHVELARDLKLPKAKREEIQKNNAKNEAANEKRRELWRSLTKGREPGRHDIKKLKLWEELGTDEMARRCVFTGRVITAAHILNGEVEVEHILPHSKTLDDGLSNLTLSFRDANRLKGNKTPWEAFGGNLHKSRGMAWEDIVERAKNLPKAKRERFSSSALKDWESTSAFVAKQMTDNAYISRLTRKYLTAVCRNVVPAPGRLTAMVRGIRGWGLNGLLGDDNKKERNDHRHHTIDAFVVGLIDHSMIQRISTKTGADGKSRIHLPKLPDDLRAALGRRLDSLVVSYKPDHGHQGKMFNGTAYGFVEEAKRDPRKPDYNLVARKPVADLTHSELETIRDPLWRKKIRDFLAEHDYDKITEKKDREKRLPRLLAEFRKRHNVKALRVLSTNDSVKPVPSAQYKGYAKGVYACCDIWALPVGKPGKWKKGERKWEGTFIAYSDCTDRGVPHPNQFKPHPAAKFIARVFKNDLVAITDDGRDRTLRVKKFKADHRLVLVPHTVAKPKEKYFSLNKLKTQNFRKLGVSPSGVVRDPRAGTESKP